MSMHQKLTKKQRKGLAFRERKTAKPAVKKTTEDGFDDMEANAIPTLENQDLDSLDGLEAENTGSQLKQHANTFEEKKKHKKVTGSSKGADTEAKSVDASEAVAVLKTKTLGKRRREDPPESGSEVQTKKAKTAAQAESKQGKQKFILFVGNLKYTTTKEAISNHFSICDPPPTVRLLTPKLGNKTGTQKVKSKGCAFLEFTHRNALQQALKLHQSDLDGRQINVELTAGGGGKSESRLEKVRERNKALLGQRVERSEKQSEGSIQSQPQKPQRFSLTSGMEHTPVTKRTWTVDSDTVDGDTHRGGKRHRKSGKTAKAWGTGVNAIPVG